MIFIGLSPLLVTNLIIICKLEGILVTTWATIFVPLFLMMGFIIICPICMAFGFAVASSGQDD
jgi:uncharacterized membrane protein